MSRGYTNAGAEEAELARAEAEEALAPGAESRQWMREYLRPGVLSSARMRELGLRVKAAREAGGRDGEAIETLVTHNMRMCLSLARKRLGAADAIGALTYRDLVQEAGIGLLHAVETWEPDIAVLSTHAYNWIRQAMSRAIADKSRHIRYPVYVATARNKVRRLSHQYALAHGEDEPPREWLLEQGVSEVELEAYDRTGGDALSLDAPAYPDDGGGEADITLMDLLADETPDATTQDVEDEDAAGSLGELLRGMLSKREVLILTLRSGATEPIWPLEKIGKLLKLSRERVRQIEEEARWTVMHAGLRPSGELRPHASKGEAKAYADKMLKASKRTSPRPAARLAQASA